MRTRPLNSAFTLIELILVMAILAIASAIIVPSLRTFGIGRTTDNAATQILNLSNYARTQAVNEGRTYRLNFDASSVWLTVQKTGVFEPADNDYGERYPMPDGVILVADVVPQPNTLLVVPDTQTQTTDQPVLPYGQPLAEPNKLVMVQHVEGTYMEFQPSGRTDPVHIQLTDKLGKVIDLGCQSATESLHVLTPAEMQ